MDLFRKYTSAFAYERAVLAVQLATMQEMYLLRRSLLATTNYMGEWMQRIDSQLDALVGSDEEFGGSDE